MASEIRAGGAFVEIFMKGNVGPQLDQVAKKLKSIGDSVTNLGKKFAGIGVAIVAPLALAAEEFGRLGDEISKAAQRTGVAVESLLSLKYAAELSGASFEDLENGIRKMQKAIFAAADGNKEAEKSLAGIGLKIEDLKGLAPDEQFVTIAQALSKVQNEAARTAIAMEIFGKGGTKLLPLMSEGADGINKLVQRAQELGIVFSGTDAAAATKFHEALADIKKQLQAVIFQIGAAVAGALQPFANAAIHCMTSVIKWAHENKALVVGILTAGVAFLAAGAALITLGLSIKAVGFAISGIRDAFRFASAAIGLLLNPIVLVGAALAGLAAYFIFASDTGAEVIDFLKSKFNALADIAKEAFGGIADALAAGDIALAAKILWVGLQAAWAEGTNELQKKWADFKAGFVQVTAAAFYGALEIWENVKESLKESWAEVVNFFKSLWQGFCNFFSDMWDGVTDSVAKGINYLTEDSDTSEKANALIDKDADQRSLSNERERQAEAAQREGEKNAAIAKARQDEAKNLHDLEADHQGLHAGADQAAADEKKELDAKKADLKAQLDALRATAKTEGDKARADDDIKKPTLGSKERAEDLENVIAERKNVDVKSAGIFNVAGLQALQGQSPLADIAKNTEAGTKYLKKISEKGTLTFGKSGS